MRATSSALRCLSSADATRGARISLPSTRAVRFARATVVAASRSACLTHLCPASIRTPGEPGDAQLSARLGPAFRGACQLSNGLLIGRGSIRSHPVSGSRSSATLTATWLRGGPTPRRNVAVVRTSRRVTRLFPLGPHRGVFGLAGEWSRAGRAVRPLRPSPGRAHQGAGSRLFSVTPTNAPGR